MTVFHSCVSFHPHRATTVIGNTGREGLENVSLPRRPPISLSLLNLLENSEGSRRSTEVLSESSSVDRLHSRQASLEATQLPSLPQQEALDALYAKVSSFRLIRTPLCNNQHCVVQFMLSTCNFPYAFHYLRYLEMFLN